MSQSPLAVLLEAFAFTFLFKILEKVKFYLQSYIPFDVIWLEYLVFASVLISILILTGRYHARKVIADSSEEHCG